MSRTPIQPQPPNPNFDGNPNPPSVMPPTAPPGTDMTGICFRDQLWLNTYPLDRNLVFDYFALSPFYDWTCNNEQLRVNGVHPLDASHLTKMTGIEYTLSEIMEPNLFVIRKQKRDSPEKVTPMLTYYVLDGSIYQAPQLFNVFASRMARSLYYISKAFSMAGSKLEKVGYVEGESDGAAADLKASKEALDLKEVKRLDHILASLQRKLGPAPPPPPFPDGYTPPQPAEAETGTEAQHVPEPQLPVVDPVIDQGPSKRLRLE